MKLIKNITQNNEWPANYPEFLRPVSWKCGEIAGPQKYWNKYVSPRFKDSKYYIKVIVKNIFEKEEIPITSEINDLINYFLKCFTIYFTNDEFKITLKKDKDKKVIFSELEWKSLCEDCGIKGRKGIDLLKHLIKNTYIYYNDLLKM